MQYACLARAGQDMLRLTAPMVPADEQERIRVKFILLLARQEGKNPSLALLAPLASIETSNWQRDQSAGPALLGSQMQGPQI